MKVSIWKLANFLKIGNGEANIFHKWAKSKLNYNHTYQNIDQLLMEKLADEQLRESGFLFQSE